MGGEDTYFFIIFIALVPDAADSLILFPWIIKLWLFLINQLSGGHKNIGLTGIDIFIVFLINVIYLFVVDMQSF